MKSKMDKINNSKVYKRLRKLYISNKTGKCSVCPYHGGENAGRKPARGVLKPKYKNKRG